MLGTAFCFLINFYAHRLADRKRNNKSSPLLPAEKLAAPQVRNPRGTFLPDEKQIGAPRASSTTVGSPRGHRLLGRGHGVAEQGGALRDRGL